MSEPPGDKKSGETRTQLTKCIADLRSLASVGVWGILGANFDGDGSARYLLDVQRVTETEHLEV